MEEARQRVMLAADDLKAFLASPAGVRLRRYLAVGVITAAPLVFRIPGLRRYPWLRALEAAGGIALIVKAAEAIRDWELEEQRSTVPS